MCVVFSVSCNQWRASEERPRKGAERHKNKKGPQKAQNAQKKRQGPRKGTERHKKSGRGHRRHRTAQKRRQGPQEVQDGTKKAAGATGGTERAQKVWGARSQYRSMGFTKRFHCQSRAFISVHERTLAVPKPGFLCLPSVSFRGQKSARQLGLAVSGAEWARCWWNTSGSEAAESVFFHGVGDVSFDFIDAAEGVRIEDQIAGGEALIQLLNCGGSNDC